MIYMNFHSMESVIDQKGKTFKKMTKLKTIIVENGHCSKGLKYLPSSLIALKWNGCLSKSLSSSILSKKFENMKILTLDQCEYLTHIPDVSCLPNLEKLSFEYCENLISIHNSIGHLNKLEILSAYGCIKLEHFPPLGLASLKKLELSWCKSLNSFPELLCKMTNIKQIELNDTSIGPLPSSFQNLSELCTLSLLECRMLRFPKHNDKMYSIVFSNVTELNIYDCNLSDECLPILLKLFVNLTTLNLTDNNFKILPECFSECHHLKHLDLYECTSLEEIRGIPPNLEELYVYECESVSFSSRRMLMSQQLHEARCTHVCFPCGTEGIPDWFEQQSRGPTFSFWFRKEIPYITFIIIIIPEDSDWVEKSRLKLFVNGCEIEKDIFYHFGYVCWNHTTLFDMKLNERCKRQYEYDMDKELLKNEWIHVELKLTIPDNWSEEEKNKMSSNCQMGIHVWKEKSNMEEENVVFTDPYLKKIKLVDYLNYSNNTSLSQFVPPLKKQRLVEVGVSETEEEEGFSRKRKIDEDINASLQQQDLTKEEQRKTWGTFLCLGESKSNADVD